MQPLLPALLLCQMESLQGLLLLLLLLLLLVHRLVTPLLL
jgi:hypothetical protein